MWKDPIVEEVRKARQEILAECDNDLGKLMERGRELLKHWKGKVVTKEELDRRRKRHPRQTPK
jgi:hypothetical protein